MKVGILELQADSFPKNWVQRLYNDNLRKQFASIIPQAVAVWCRQLGHEVYFATFYGQQDPKSLLPDRLDVVFISAFTQASAFAYALAKLYRRENTLTVIGGPHARSFPIDCLRFFDVVVHDCDKTLVDDILRRSFDCNTIVSSGRLLEDIPSVEERLPEIVTANFTNGRPTVFSHIALLSSLGCPYRCDFCVDWNNPYVMLSTEHLEADLRYLSKHFPGIHVVYHDPNFGVKFEKVLDVIEAIPENARNPYIIESSLSILQGPRLHRLRETNCVYVASGVESWAGYSNKAGVGAAIGEKKLEKVVAHFEEICRYVPMLQANFIFGTDIDEGDEPIELSKEFIQRLPVVWPAINIPVAYGGTPLYDRYLAEDRILKSIPFSFYYMPYSVIKLKNYSPLEYYEKLVDFCSVAASGNTFMRRVSNTRGFRYKMLSALRSLSIKDTLSKLRFMWEQLKTDNQLRIFHEGRSNTLPDFYKWLYKEKLGPYAELITEAEMSPELQQLSAPVSLTPLG